MEPAPTGFTGITLLRAEHAPAYRALMLQAYAQHPDAFTSSVAERAGLPLAWWESRIGAGSSSHEQVLGAFQDGRLAGAAGLSIETREKTRHKALLFGMYVDPGFRRFGWGRQLVSAVMALARSHEDLALVQLTVTHGNRAAQTLYEQAGFEVFGIEPGAMQVGGAYFAKVHMWCRLRDVPVP